MARLRVSHANDQAVGSEDALGRHHIARPLHRAPRAGAEFHGARPERGFTILWEESSQRSYRVMTFEEVSQLQPA